MTCIHRVTIAFLFAGLFVPNAGRAGPSQGPTASANPEKKTCMISGTIRMRSNEPIEGVRATAEPGGYTAVTDAQGRYFLTVPYGWSGRVILSKPGYEFVPAGTPYTNVTSNIIDGDRQPTAEEWPALPRPGAPGLLPTAGGSVLVIPTEEVTPQKLAETSEDMRVMLQILREKLSEPRLIRGRLIDYGDFFGDEDRAAEVFFLQGHAVMFVMRIDFPLSPTAAPPASEGEADKEAADPVWQRARQKLQNPALRGGPAGQTPGTTLARIKETLLQSLRHAANIRHVGPNEWIILTVVSQAEPSGSPAPASVGGSYSRGAGGWFEGSSYSSASSSFGPSGGTTQADSGTRSRGVVAGRPVTGRSGPSPAPGAAATVLTIQAKKCDIDAFAQGSLSFEQFQQRVKTFTY